MAQVAAILLIIQKVGCLIKQSLLQILVTRHTSNLLTHFTSLYILIITYHICIYGVYPAFENQNNHTADVEGALVYYHANIIRNKAVHTHTNEPCGHVRHDPLITHIKITWMVPNFHCRYLVLFKRLLVDNSLK